MKRQLMLLTILHEINPTKIHNISQTKCTETFVSWHFEDKLKLNESNLVQIDLIFDIDFHLQTFV
jgi:hypothetical protein